MASLTRVAGASAAGLLALSGCNLSTTASPASPSASASPRAGTSRATARASPRTRSSIPIKVISGSDGTLILIPVRVDGRGPYEFLLDTGSSTSSVNKSLQRRLDLPTTGAVQRVAGVTGQSTVPVVSIAHWSIGGMSISPADVAVINLDSRSTGLAVSGLLGSDELSKFGSVTIDFTDQLLYLRH
jgi:predicted aspartyl protease